MKTLAELTYEVNTLHKDIVSTLNDQVRIIWQDGGTLTYFGDDDGFPELYWRPGRQMRGPLGQRENYATLQGIMVLMMMHIDNSFIKMLLTRPVWRVATHCSALKLLKSDSSGTEAEQAEASINKRVHYFTGFKVTKAALATNPESTSKLMVLICNHADTYKISPPKDEKDVFAVRVWCESERQRDFLTSEFERVFPDKQGYLKWTEK